MNNLISIVTQETEHRQVVFQMYDRSESSSTELENERITIAIDEHGIAGHTSHGVSERYYESDRGTLITEKEDCLHNITEKWEFDRSGILLKYEKKMPDGATQLLINDKDNPFSKQEIAFLPVNK
ncbi:MAG: hypothetical protein K5705_07440 [Oscillospiraceae bacterium]|nr:hypothetical protein [Oscillospiraceae bacterium]